MKSEIWKTTHVLAALVFGIVLVVGGVRLATASDVSVVAQTIAATVVVPFGVVACLLSFRLMRSDARPFR
jgi:branched-subunit amino acid permease